MLGLGRQCGDIMVRVAAGRIGQHDADRQPEQWKELFLTASVFAPDAARGLLFAVRTG